MLLNIKKKLVQASTVMKRKSSPQVFDKVQANSCCLDLGFKTTSDNSDTVKHALTYHFIDKITKRAFKKRADPAWRVQRYNGYTDLMGAAEGVSPWRAGVDYYKNPAYGYQTMDFIINSLMFNPYISKKVDKESKDQNQKWDSILCKGKADGTYHIDSDFYFDKHKDSTRLKVILDKYKKGFSYNQLSRRERKVLGAELAESSFMNSKMPNTLPQRKFYKLQNSIEEELNKNKDIESSSSYISLIKRSKVSKEDWLNSIKGNHKYTTKQLDDFFDYNQKSIDLSAKEDLLNDEISAFYNEVQKLCEKYIDANYEQYQSCQNETNSLYPSIQDNSVENVVLFKDPALIKQNEKIITLSKKYSSIPKEYSALESEYSNMSNSIYKDSDAANYIYRKLEKVESVDETIARLKSNPNYSDKLEKDIKDFFETRANQDKKYSKNEAYKEYFKSVYQDRNTLQKSSVFPWRKFNEEETLKLIDKFNSQK
jgi:hypothetical protein